MTPRGVRLHDHHRYMYLLLLLLLLLGVRLNMLDWMYWESILNRGLAHEEEPKPSGEIELQ